MNINRQKLVYAGVAVVIIILVLFFVGSDEPTKSNDYQNATTTSSDISVEGVQYKNTEYGFLISLPESWQEYSIVEDNWEGYSLDDKEEQFLTESGALISVRHPDWEYKSPRQDIPVMVFTLKQWSDLMADKFHIGAAPVNPSEIGRNKLYVFATPARYSFSHLTGYEEVERILREKSFKPF